MFLAGGGPSIPEQPLEPLENATAAPVVQVVDEVNQATKSMFLGLPVSTWLLALGVVILLILVFYFLKRSKE